MHWKVDGVAIFKKKKQPPSYHAVLLARNVFKQLSGVFHQIERNIHTARNK